LERVFSAIADFERAKRNRTDLRVSWYYSGYVVRARPGVSEERKHTKKTGGSGAKKIKAKPIHGGLKVPDHTVS